MQAFNSLSHLEKYDCGAFARSQKMISNRVATELYLFQIRKGKMSIKPFKKIWSSLPYSDIQDSITQWEGISIPHVYYSQREPFS